MNEWLNESVNVILFSGSLASSLRGERGEPGPKGKQTTQTNKQTNKQTTNKADLRQFFYCTTHIISTQHLCVYDDRYSIYIYSIHVVFFIDHKRSMILFQVNMDLLELKVNWAFFWLFFFTVQIVSDRFSQRASCCVQNVKGNFNQILPEWTRSGFGNTGSKHN